MKELATGGRSERPSNLGGICTNLERRFGERAIVAKANNVLTDNNRAQRPQTTCETPFEAKPHHTESGATK